MEQMDRSSSSRLSGDSRFSCNICLDTVSDEPVVTLCGHVYCWHCLYQWLKPGLTAAEQAELGIRRTLTTSDASRRVCPTCKSSCSVRQVIPIYVRAEEQAPEDDDASERKEAEEGVENGDDFGSDQYSTEGLRRRNTSSRQQLAGNQTSTRDSSHGEIPTQLDRSSPEDESAVPRRESVFSPLVQVNSRLAPASVDDSIPRRPTVRLTERNEVRLEASPQLYPSASLSHGMFPLVNQATHDQGADDGATEYLSRLLLLLGSFVVLCLLVFP